MYYLFMLFSFYFLSMVTEKPVFPENDHFNLKLYISASICRTFSNKCIFKIIIACCKKTLFHLFLKLFADVFSCPLKVKLVKKTLGKFPAEPFFDITAERNKFYKFDTLICYPSSLSQKSFTQYLLFKVIQISDSKVWLLRDFWIKNRMSFPKLLFSMIKHKNKPICNVIFSLV